MSQETTLHDIAIVEYQTQYASAFKKLNTEWIEKHFTIEAHDLEQLDHPEENIIRQGGHILFARYQGAMVGTCALIETGTHEYELAKMGVTPALRGKQIGNILALAAIEKAKTMGAKRIWLESNRVLTAAINLYRKLGFIEIPLSYTPYARADIRMEMWL